MASPTIHTLCCVCASPAELQCSACARSGPKLYFCSPEHQKLASRFVGLRLFRRPPADNLANRRKTLRSGSPTNRFADRGKPSSKSCPNCRPPNSKFVRCPSSRRGSRTRAAGAISTFACGTPNASCCSRLGRAHRWVIGSFAVPVRLSAPDPLCLFLL